MYNIKQAIGSIKLYDQNFLDNIPELEVYRSYVSNLSVGKVVKSPFRKDLNPSFGLYYSKTGNKLNFHDFSTGECGGVVDFVMKIENCNFKEAIAKIKLLLGDKINNYKKPTYEYLKTNNKIGIVRQPFTKTDLSFWNSFYINRKTLNKFNVFSIKYYLLNDNVKWIYRDDSIMFAYKINDRFKIYRPFEKSPNKWRTNCTTKDIQGLQQLPVKGDLLVVTKSLKDVMVLYELGIPAISPSSENSKISLDFVKELKKRFKNIIILFDNDEAGITNSAILYDLCKDIGDIYNISIDKRYKVKDISDFVKKYGIEKTNIYLTNVIKKNINRPDKDVN